MLAVGMAIGAAGTAMYYSTDLSTAHSDAALSTITNAVSPAAEMAATDADRMFKLTLVGDSGVGKSNLVLRYASDVFVNEHVTTIGCDLKVKYLEARDLRIKLMIWDTAGQERFHALTQSYNRGANGVVFTFDLTEQDSFDKLGFWIREVDRQARSDCFKLLVRVHGLRAVFA